MRPVPIFRTKPLPRTPIEPLTSMAHVHATKLAVTVCGSSMTIVVEALDGFVTFPSQFWKAKPGFGVAVREVTEPSGSLFEPAGGVVLPPAGGETCMVNGSVSATRN